MDEYQIYIDNLFYGGPDTETSRLAHARSPTLRRRKKKARWGGWSRLSSGAVRARFGRRGEAAGNVLSGACARARVGRHARAVNGRAVERCGTWGRAGRAGRPGEGRLGNIWRGLRRAWRVSMKTLSSRFRSQERGGGLEGRQCCPGRGRSDVRGGVAGGRRRPAGLVASLRRSLRQERKL